MTNIGHVVEETEFLRVVAREGAQVGPLLEIGSDDGSGSTLILGLIAKEFKRDLWCVDTFCDRSGLENEEWRNLRTAKMMTGFIGNVTATRLWDYIRVLRMHSMSAADCLAHIDFGFILIDGDHTDPGVSDDFRSWPRRIMEGGILAAHDANTADVAKAIADWERTRTRTGTWESLGSKHMLAAWRRTA